MKESDNIMTKILIGFLLFACGPLGIGLYALGKRSNK